MLTFWWKCKFESNLSNYATNTHLKRATGVDASDQVAKPDLASLKAKVVQIDIDKLKTVSADLSEISNVVDNDVVKKTKYDKLVIKVNTILSKINISDT